MGSYDGAETCELVGSFLLSQLQDRPGSSDVILIAENVWNCLLGPDHLKAKIVYVLYSNMCSQCSWFSGWVVKASDR